MDIIYQKFKDVYTEELAEGAILNEEFEGFREDYLILHCLLRKYNPESVFELGTNMGVGTNIICAAVPDAKVYSLDLPTELAHISLQHPISEGKGDKVGTMCTRPYIQLRGDSLKYQYFPVEAAFIDGEHDYEHPSYETEMLADLGTNLLIWHDSDIEEVWRGIKFGLFATAASYQLYRVEDTRIAYALKIEAE